MKPKENNSDFEKRIKKQSKKIIKNKDSILCPDINVEYTKVNNHWFNISETEKFDVDHEKLKHTLIKKENVKLKAKKVILKLTKKQKKIIDKWLHLYLQMYNITLKYIKNTIKTDKKCLNFLDTRKNLFNIKKKLLQNSTVSVHDIDGAIKLACSNYKSALSNLKARNIKNFRIRYWNRNKPIKIINLEQSDFSKNTIRNKVLGKVVGYYNGKEFDFNVDHDCRLQKNNNKYFLFVPETIEKTVKYKKQNEDIAIDLGIRTFATCISENKAIRVGDNCSKRISKYLKRKDAILGNEKINHEIKKKNELMINKKINNLVDEMHWQFVNYLIKNYKTIIIGDLSAKSIVKKSGNLSKITKRTALCLKFYQFKERLKYKCNVNKTDLGIIDEWYTSKMCSLCGNINEKLGSDKIYNCKKCKCTIDRDINGARNIYIKSIK